MGAKVSLLEADSANGMLLTFAWMLSVVGSMPWKYPNIDTHRPPDGFKLPLKMQSKSYGSDEERRKELVQNHNQFGSMIPLELDRNYDRWVLQYERDISSKYENDPESEPVAILYYFNRQIYKQPAPAQMKLKMPRGVASGTLRNPYPGRAEFNYSLGFMHLHKVANKSVVCPVKSYWFAMEPKRILC